MRIIGQAERALEMMCQRLKSRIAFGKEQYLNNQFGMIGLLSLGYSLINLDYSLSMLHI